MRFFINYFLQSTLLDLNRTKQNKFFKLQDDSNFQETKSVNRGFEIPPDLANLPNISAKLKKVSTMDSQVKCLIRSF